MSKNDENNSHLFIKNNSTQNLYLPSHQKNKSSNFLSDSPSTLITVQIQSLNGDQNSKSKDNNNIRRIIFYSGNKIFITHFYWLQHL